MLVELNVIVILIKILKKVIALHRTNNNMTKHLKNHFNPNLTRLC